MLILAFAAAPTNSEAQGESPPGQAAELGSGAWRFRWARAWEAAHAELELGGTHGGLALDREGNLYACSDGERAVLVFAPDGSLLRSFGAEFAGGLHGLMLAREGEQEFLYLAHSARGEVLKTTLAGEVLWTLSAPLESGLYPEGRGFHPTAVALLPDGGLCVADGYGAGFVHSFDRERRYLGSVGGPGSALGELATPHGLWLDTRGPAPRVLVADRENQRLQYFDLTGKALGEVRVGLRRPAAVSAQGEFLAVADLCGRVTLLDAQDRVVLHLGENPDRAQWADSLVPRSAWREGTFIAPHALLFDSAGNLFVSEWLRAGRLVKLERLH